MRPQPDISSTEKNCDDAKLITEQVDIHGIPEDWKLSSLICAVGGVNSLVVGGPFGSNLKVEHYQKNGIPIIRLQNVDSTRFVKKDIKYVSPEKAKELYYHSYKAGDIVLAKLGNPIGKSCLVPTDFEDGIVVADVVRIRNRNPKIDSQYLMYALNSQNTLNQLNRQVRGSTRPRVNVSEVRQLVIPIPPLSAQRAIARALRAAQEAKAARQREIELDRECKAALMQHLFTYGVSGVATKQTDIGEIPQHWNVVELGDKHVARTITGGTPSRMVADYFGGNIPWVKSGDLNDTRILDTEEKITQKGLENSNARMLPAGTLLIAMYGATAGKTGLLSIEASTNQAICAISPVNSSFSSTFLQYYLIYIRPKILNARSGGAQPNINQQFIKALRIPQPPIPEQNHLSNVLDTIDQKIACANHEISLLEEFFRAMLEELITGRLSSKSLIEVATA